MINCFQYTHRVFCKCVKIGASGAGHGGNGGQGTQQDVVGGSKGNVYQPQTFGSAGGAGGGVTSADCNRLDSNGNQILTKDLGGAGGGIIELIATDTVDIDGEVNAKGTDSQGWLYAVHSFVFDFCKMVFISIVFFVCHFCLFSLENKEQSWSNC